MKKKKKPTQFLESPEIDFLTWLSSQVSLEEKFCCCSGAKWCLTLWDPMDYSMSGSSVPHCLLEFPQIHVSQRCLLLHLLLPSIFSNIRVFSSESALCIRWPKYWSFSFSISPSNEQSGLISFRINSFDLLAVQGTQSLLQHHSSKASMLKKKKL